MKCEYADCKTENHKNHIVKYGFYDGSQRYKCLNCNRYFIKQEDRKRKSLTDDEKHIIDRLVDENISYRAIARVLNRHYVFKHHSTTLTMCATHIQKKTR